MQEPQQLTARIVQCAEDGGDWKQLCATLQVNPKTAYVWVKTCAEERRPLQVTAEKLSRKSKWTDALCVLNGRGRSVHFAQRTERMAVEWFWSQGVGFIKNVYHQMEVNNPRNKALRLEYVQLISKRMLQNKTIIWMDETNINLYCRRTRGRAPAGQRAVVALPGSKGSNVHVIGVLTNFQVVKWSRLQGAFRSQRAKDWFANMMLQHLPQGSTSTHR